jgi:exopolysaccharide production protein ExoZ
MLKNIQMLRALAALSVMLFHGATIYKEATGGLSVFMAAIGQYGYLGVDLFFVISGFVAAHTTLYRERYWLDARQYLYQRFTRIYLGYWPFFALSILVAACFQADLMHQWNWLRSFFLAFLIGMHDGRDLVLFVSWSLSYELIFYILIALTFAISTAKTIILINVSAIVLIIILGAAQAESMPIALWTFLCFFFEFVLGALIRTHANRFRGFLGAFLAMIMFTIGIYLLMQADLSLIAERAFSAGIASAGLVMLMYASEEAKLMIVPKWIAELGDSSYTLYLAHVIFWSLIGYSGTTKFLATLPTEVSAFGYWFLVVLCVMICKVYSARIEMPMYRWSISLGERQIATRHHP